MTCIVVMDSNSSGNAIPAVHAAHRRGLTARLLARQPEEYQSKCPELLEIVDTVHQIDTMDAVQVSRAIDEIPEACVAVLAFDELRIVQAAYAAAQVGAQHASVSAVARLRFKDRVRAALSDTEFDVRHSLVTPGGKVPAPDFDWPCVVKPVDEADSEGVAVCGNLGELREAVDRIRAMAGTANSRGYIRRAEALVEEFIDGPEFSAEMVWDARAKRFRLVGITSRELAPGDLIEQPETGHVFPVPEADFSGDVESFADRILRKIGLSYSVAHLEFRVDPQERLRLLEVNPRCGGGHIGDLVEAVRGIHLAALQLAAQLGDAGEMLDAAPIKDAAGIVFLDPSLRFEIRTGRTIEEVRGKLAMIRPEATEVGGRC